MDYLPFDDLLAAVKRGDMTVDDVGRELIKNNWSEFVDGKTLYTDRQMRAILNALPTRHDRDAVLGWFSAVNDAIRVMLETELHLMTALAEVRAMTLELLTNDQLATSRTALRGQVDRCNRARQHLAQVEGVDSVLRDVAVATRLPIAAAISRLTEEIGHSIVAESNRAEEIGRVILGDETPVIGEPPADVVKQREREVDALFAESFVDGWRAKVKT